MPDPSSRYRDLGTYTVITETGATVTATRLPLPAGGALRGFHRRLEGQRLDLIANHYLTDPTAFWRLCDANGAMVPDALGAHDLVGIPVKGR
ncbi:MAG TPA: hypothetical protein VFK02_26425 [Kofleriaceae bacterium]|nr:hypothetical protein [Kofleriaceae bacterium]